MVCQEGKRKAMEEAEGELRSAFEVKGSICNGLGSSNYTKKNKEAENMKVRAKGREGQKLYHVEAF